MTDIIKEFEHLFKFPTGDLKAFSIVLTIFCDEQEKKKYKDNFGCQNHLHKKKSPFISIDMFKGNPAH